MIASKEIEQIFTYFRSKYDAIVIDTAPCLLVSTHLVYLASQIKPYMCLGLIIQIKILLIL